MEFHIGKMAKVANVWYRIIEVRESNGQLEYRLESKDYWVPNSWVTEIKDNT
ncbi:hypothetical protein U8V72_15180 [Priestia filamentosa]|uniref:hypothetical protein n=1 Tax=Priestia filamentosa TaxID=1402861 RepID=UPI00397CF441